jgi:hypothetical protein
MAVGAKTARGSEAARNDVGPWGGSSGRREQRGRATRFVGLDSLRTGKLSGNFTNLTPDLGGSTPNARDITKDYVDCLLRTEQGIFRREQGICS